MHRAPAITLRHLVPFLLLTFFLTWGILALYLFQSDWMADHFGPLSGEHPLFFLATWSPAIAAFLVVASRTGASGLRRFIARATRWRAGWRWYLFLLLGLPLLFYAGAAWKGTLATDPFPFDTARALLLALLLGAIKGPVEEFGWRGFALPLLQRRLAPFWAALAVGIVWGCWHLPAFLISGTQQSSWSFLPFFAGTVVISLIIAALYNDTRGSIFLAAFMHFQLMNPIWPDAQPYDTYLLAVVAAGVVWWRRKTMFRRDSGLTEVVPPAEGAA
jgi:membrane protease YdiL (CAAX protease family)